MKLVKVNADEAPEVSRRFEVQAIPTLVLINHGEVVDQQVGAAPAPALRSWLGRAPPDEAGVHRPTASAPTRTSRSSGRCRHPPGAGARSDCQLGTPGCICGSASPAARSAAATPPRCATRALTPPRRATSSCGRSSPGRTGGGAMPTSSSSELGLPDLPETPDTTGAYPRLTDEQIMLLSRYGERRRLTKGSMLFCEGDRDCGLFVVLDGRVRVVQEDNPEARAARDRRPRAGSLRGRSVAADRSGGLRHRRRPDRRRGPGDPLRPAQGGGDRGPGARRPDPAGLHPPTQHPRRPRRGPADHRLALLGRHPPAEGLREPQPHPVPLGSTWRRIPRQRRSCGRSASHRTRRRS